MQTTKYIGILFIAVTLLLTACTVGPNYIRPKTEIPIKFKEAPKGWKVADPKDVFKRGAWWEIFNDPQLNALENQLNISNQNIAAAAAQYRQAVALVAEARAAYFPTISGGTSYIRQKQGVAGFTSSSNSNSFTTGTTSVGAQDFYALLLNGTWTPDIWGLVRRQVEAANSSAQASAATLALARLSAQVSLGQFYFELRALDTDQKLLDSTVVDYAKILQLTQYQYNSGVAQLSDVVQARSALETAQAAAINNGILRAQYEHAIAVLIGVPPANFSMKFNPLTAKPPKIPIEVPSLLLERRPDIANAERLMQQANANIGVAIAAYFPSLTLSGAVNYQANNLSHILDPTNLGWSIGGQLAETLIDGGLRSATVTAARANYDATVATYRQTVLAAFQNVEDNLVALRILGEQVTILDKAAADARLALKLVINQYKMGTAQYSQVLQAQISAFSAEKSAADIAGLRMSTAVGLISALGGGWDNSITNLDNPFILGNQ